MARIALILALAAAPRAAADTDNRIFWTRAGGVAAIAAWGTLTWHYFEHRPHVTDEGWFGADTKEGGADKIGHLYVSHVLTQGLADVYEHWGLDRGDAGRQAAISSLLILGFMELGDGFSPTYGFSGEDLAMNMLGSLVGYQLHSDETWRRRIDLRAEYRGHGSSDPFTDYSHNRYLVSLKLEGFDRMRNTPLGYLEFQVGYYARGYDSPVAADSRHLYAGVSINFPRLLRQAGLKRVSRVLNYLQPPGTTLAVTRELGR